MRRIAMHVLKRMLCGCVGLAIAALVATDPAQARSHDTSGASGEFDYFLLSLSIAPSFCALSPANAAKQECRSLTATDFRDTPLTVHGLWPNLAGASVNRQPQDCDGPPLGSLSGPLQAELLRFMPAGPGLASYEWRKHGACSGLSPEAYFSAVVRLAQHANETIGAVMREQGMLGHVVRIADLLAAVAIHDPSLPSAIVVDCRFPRGGGQALIDEIRVTLSKSLVPIPAQSMGLGQNSGCPQGAGLLPAGPN